MIDKVQKISIIRINKEKNYEKKYQNLSLLQL